MTRHIWSIKDARWSWPRSESRKTKHGKPAVVVVAAEEYECLRKLRHLKAPSLPELLLATPRGDVEFDRLKAALRDVEF